MEREFLGVWIPKEIYLHKGLTPTEKLLMAEIMSFSKNGVCFASNEHFSEFLGISKGHVSKLLTKLARLNLVKIDLTYKDGTKEVDKRFITPTISQEDTPLPILTQEHTPILIDEHTPIVIDEYTPTHSGVDPIRIQEHTPTHSGVDPILVDEYYKEHIKESFKEQDKIKIKNNKKNNVPIATLEAEFDKLWAIYPRKQNRKNAFESYKKARKDKKVPYETIENGLYRYLRYIEQADVDSQFIPYGSTWFNQHRWQDEYAIQANKKPKNHFEYLQMKYGGMNNEPTGSGEILDDHAKIISDYFQG